MEFASFHLQHQLQEESAQCIMNSETPPPNDSKPFTTTSQSWIPSNIYNGCSNGFQTETFTNSRELQHNKHAMTDSLRISTRQAFDFQNGKVSFTQHPSSDLFPARLIKGEIINNSMKGMEESCSLISNYELQYSSPSFLSSLGVTGEGFFPAENNVYHNDKLVDGGMTLISKRSYNFGDDITSLSNLPTLDMTPSLVSCSLGLNPSTMLDLHKSYVGIQHCYDGFGLSKSLSQGDMHGLQNSPSNSSNKGISSFTREVAMTKRPSNCLLSKESEAKTKKSRPACPPLKVRKEKLGDRIQTLQRLVAPFGKTSTASVLSEAIGYTHFLHQQIQTLSIPYMKSAQSKPSRMVQLDSNTVDSRELKPDLRSRGLCLVPLSYASFIHRCV